MGDPSQGVLFDHADASVGALSLAGMARISAGLIQVSDVLPSTELIDPAAGEPLGTQPTRRFRWLKLALLASDLIAVSLAMLLASSVHQLLPTEATNASTRQLAVGLMSLPVWVASLVHYRLYNARYVSSRLFEFRRLVHAAGASVMATAALAFMAKLYVPRSWLVMTFALTVVGLALSRDAFRRLLDSQRRLGRLQRSVAIIGANNEGRDIAQMLAQAPIPKYRVAGFIDDDLPAGAIVDGVPVLGGVASTVTDLRRHGIGNVLIASTSLGLQASSRLAFDLTAANLHVELCTGLCDVAPERLTVERVGRLPVLYVEPVCLGGWRGGAKRCFDVTLASIGLLLAAPILAVAAIAIKIDSRGPVLFRQRRVGRRGRSFEILKLRSMVGDAEALMIDLREQNEADGPLFKMRDDPRITRVGRVLRTLSIDELPQLWNVLRGEMSLVGPRPALASEIAGWSAELHDRLAVRPGITGMWQVSGRSNASFEEYTRLDLYYVRNWSLLTDLAMVAKTIPTVLSRRGSC
jgi:exopolysaccharide biosynthesis polyprenyl glycosylphosphotransferase